MILTVVLLQLLSNLSDSSTKLVFSKLPREISGAFFHRERGNCSMKKSIFVIVNFSMNKKDYCKGRFWLYKKLKKDIIYK